MPSEISSGLPVITIHINEMGQMKRMLPRLTQEEQLENTLLQGLYPGIRVARLNVPPGRLEDHQENEVQRSMRSFDLDGVRFRLIGASASAKSGKFYAVDERYEPAIAERFRKWPEAAITYFGILVSPCKQRIQLPDARVMVVKDHTLGTNDCRGSISSAWHLKTRRRKVHARSCRTMSLRSSGPTSSCLNRVSNPNTNNPHASWTSSIGDGRKSRFAPTGGRWYSASGRFLNRSNSKAATR